MRLDQAVAERGLAQSRSRARDAILRGHVSLNGIVALKPAAEVSDGDDIAMSDPAAGYVSRGALKLAAALDHFGFKPAGRKALDIGASTGGFTQILLERGAASVTAIDVGHGQLARELSADRRVRNLEGVNARTLDPAHIGDGFGILVSDVSFVSQRLVLPAAMSLCGQDAFAAILVKPQFEVGRQNIGKGGIVRDPAIGEKAAHDLAEWLDGRAGWRVEGLISSPIAGGDGNAEFLLGARRDGR